jgi:hypothetical protein
MAKLTVPATRLIEIGASQQTQKNELDETEIRADDKFTTKSEIYNLFRFNVLM